MKKMIAMVAALALASSALAIDYVGAGGAIPDFASSTPGSISTDIVVGDSFSISDVNVTVNGLTHTWAGDLIITLSRVSGGAGSATLVSRVGSTTPTGFGDSSNLSGNYGFDSQSANDYWAAGAAAPGTDDVIAPGTYWTSGALSSANNLSLNAFNGQNSAGTWRLTISDNAGGDTGSFQGWTLSIVPEPASLSLLVLGALSALRRR